MYEVKLTKTTTGELGEEPETSYGFEVYKLDGEKLSNGYQPKTYISSSTSGIPKEALIALIEKFSKLGL